MRDSGTPRPERADRSRSPPRVRFDSVFKEPGAARGPRKGLREPRSLPFAPRSPPRESRRRPAARHSPAIESQQLLSKPRPLPFMLREGWGTAFSPPSKPSGGGGMELADSFASFAYQRMRHPLRLTSRERWGMSHPQSSPSRSPWGMTLNTEGKRPEILSALSPRLSGLPPGEA
jgi:hypothetical protein